MAKLNYNPEEKQLFMLNMLANVNSGIITRRTSEKGKKALGQCAKSIQALLKKPAIKAVVGDWELAWGPYISYSQMSLSANDYAEIKAALENENTAPNHSESFDDTDLNHLELNLFASLGAIPTPNTVDFSEEQLNSGSSHLVTDNTMYAIRRVNKTANDSGPDYFIGIAGTNSVSPFGWFKEDFDVATMKAWSLSLIHI